MVHVVLFATSVVLMNFEEIQRHNGDGVGVDGSGVGVGVGVGVVER